MARTSTRRGGSITRFIEDIVDDTKELVDDLIDRGRDVEDDVRRGAKNVADDVYKDEPGSDRGRRTSSRSSADDTYTSDDLDKLRGALSDLTKKVDQLADAQAKQTKA